MSLRYRLDDLGWYQFEGLVQSLLKAELGLSVESWGGTKDLGRDAVSRHPLAIMGGEPQAGPFLFQIKFVQNANAAGAIPRKAIMGSIRREIDEEKKRSLVIRILKPKWYVLITNATLTAKAREEIHEVLSDLLVSASILCWDGKDLCDMLDRHPELRKSHPEILSLRDLETLLRESVHSEVYERSRAAIEETRDLVPVFVATSAYEKTWKILAEHNLAVLDGPPEMGKTAIARSVGLGHLLNNWQVIDCRQPEDVFKVYDAKERQLFIADDAFGRTEFEVDKARKWESDLPKLLYRLDARHRLLFTARRHILKRAVAEMDLQGRAEAFPDPGEVIVEAADLTVEEKSRILYRHAKTLSEGRERKLVKTVASELIESRHFTPERIRRFTRDVPRLASLEKDAETVKKLCFEAIENPTERMRKTLLRLPEDHRWLLISMLDAVSSKSEEVEASYRRVAPGGAPFGEIARELDGTFIRSQILFPGHSTLNWIHPSYRDLLIDHLRGSTSDRQRFLRYSGHAGLSLAVSVLGGSAGERTYPLLVDQADVDTFDARIDEMSCSAPDYLSLIISIASSIRADEGSHTIREHLMGTLGVMLRAWSISVAEGEAAFPDSVTFNQIVAGAQAAGVEWKLPRIEEEWDRASYWLKEHAKDGALSLALSDADGWVGLRDVVTKHYPDFSNSRQFLDDVDLIESSILAEAEEAAQGPLEPDPESDELADRFTKLSELVVEIGRDGTEELANELEERAEFHRDPYYEEPDDDYQERGPARHIELFSIKNFFADL